MMLREPWRTRLLFLSFAVNLITIPLAAQRVLAHRPPALPGGPPPPRVVLERLEEELSADDARKLREAMRPHLTQLVEDRARMEAARGAISRAIEREPFDRGRLDAAMHDWQGASAQLASNFGAALLDGVAEISPEGRQHIARAGQRRHGQ